MRPLAPWKGMYLFVRVMHRVFRLTLALGLLLLVLCGAVIWRVQDQPLSIDFARDWVEDAVNSEGAAWRVRIDTLELGWRDGRPDLGGRGVDVLDTDGRVVASLPRVGVGFDSGAILTGTLAPSTIFLDELTARVERTADDGIRFALDVADTDDPPPAEPEDAVASDGLNSRDATIDLDALLARLRARKDSGSFRRLVVRDAALAIDDQVLGVSWRLTNLNLRLGQTESGGIDLAADATAAFGDSRAHLTARTSFEPAEGIVPLRLTVEGLAPAALTPLDPSLSRLAAYDGRVDAEVRVDLDSSLAVLGLEGTIEAGAGTLDLPGFVEPVRIRRARVEARTVGGLSRIEATDIEIRTDLGEIAGSASSRPTDEGRSLSIVLDRLETSVLAPVSTALQPLGGSSLMVGGMIGTVLDADGGIGPVSVSLDRIAGTLDPFALRDEPFEVTAGSATATIDPAGPQVDLERMALTVDGVDLAVEGRLTGGDEKPSAHVEVRVPEIATDRLFALWPPTLAPGGRAWGVRNMEGGGASDAVAVFDVSLEPGFAGVEDVDAAIDFDASGLTIRFWDPLPPIRNAKGHGRLRGEQLEIAVTGGQSQGVSIKSAMLLFQHLAGPVERVQVDAALEGAAKDILTILDRPPLRYASYLGLDPAAVSGKTTGTVHVALPLEKDVTFDDIDVTAKASIRDGRVPGIAMGRDVTNADLDIEVTPDRLRVSGKGRLDGHPADLSATLAFDETVEPAATYSVRTTLDAATRARLGLDSDMVDEDHLAGPIDVTAKVTEDRNAGRTVDIEADMAAARLGLPEIGWKKEPGVAARASARLLFVGERLDALPAFSVEAGDLSARGRALFDEQGRTARIEIDPLVVAGRQDLNVVILPTLDGGVDATIGGRRLDAGFLLDELGDTVAEDQPAARPPASKPTADAAAASTLVLRVEPGVDRVSFGGSREIDGLHGWIARRDGGWAADLQGSIGAAPAAPEVPEPGSPPGAGMVRFVAEVAEGRQTASLWADPASELIAALGLTDNMRGGRLRVDASLPPGTSGPIDGKLVITDFRMLRLPVIAHVLSAASITGPLNLLSAGQGLAFTELEAPFRVDGGTVRLAPGRAYGPALGVTFNGDVDTGRDTIDLKGTIVPAYTLNRVLDAIPILGTLLTGGEGEGVFAATYTARGEIEDPKVAINPLTALAPGFLRRLVGAILTPDSDKPGPEPERRIGKSEDF